MFSLLLSLIPGALACGGMFGPPASMAMSHTQEAIFTPGDGQVQVEYRILYNGDTEDFGWVIPIPGDFVDLADGDGATFDRLRDLTRPEEDFKDVSPGCLAGAAKGGDNALGETGAGRQGGLDIVGSGFTGTYEYVVLAATDAQALLDWLELNGLSVGPSGPTIERYVAEGGWLWVALKLQTEQTDPDQTLKLPPVSITYAGDRVVFPSRMAQSSMADTIHTVVWVQGDQKARASDGWTSEELHEVYEEGESGDYVASQLFPEVLREAGERQQWWVVYADQPEGDAWVTRFETLSSPDALIVDATFALDAGVEPVHTVLTNDHGCAGALPLGLLVPGLLWGLGRRRR